MNIKPFALEWYFSKYEFSVRYLLGSSDCTGLAQKELLDLADDEGHRLWNDLRLGYTEYPGLSHLRESCIAFRNVQSLRHGGRPDRLAGRLLSGSRRDVQMGSPAGRDRRFSSTAQRTKLLRFL